jgi:acyl-CoA thioesterase
MSMSADERARRAAEAMWSGDSASKWVGMRIVSVTEGAAQLSLTLAGHHCNGHGIGHGGVTFTLADSAFAFACNSRNRRAVAQHNSITYLAPARAGDTLTATAREVALKGRSGVYDVEVVNGDGVLIATFRGLSRLIEGALFDEHGEEST